MNLLKFSFLHFIITALALHGQAERVHVHTYSIVAHHHASYDTRYMLPLIEFAVLFATFSSTLSSLVTRPGLYLTQDINPCQQSRRPHAKLPEKKHLCPTLFLEPAAPDPKNPKSLRCVAIKPMDITNACRNPQINPSAALESSRASKHTMD